MSGAVTPVDKATLVVVAELLAGVDAVADGGEPQVAERDAHPSKSNEQLHYGFLRNPRYGTLGLRP